MLRFFVFHFINYPDILIGVFYFQVKYFASFVHIVVMIVLNQLLTLQSIIVTLDEKRTITAPYYLFVFENVTSKEVVKIIINSAADLSNYQKRFNEFEINPSVLFANKQPGQWNYFVYEQASNTNLDATGLTKVEMGKMVLKNTNKTFTWQ